MRKVILGLVLVLAACSKSGSTAEITVVQGRFEQANSAYARARTELNSACQAGGITKVKVTFQDTGGGSQTETVSCP